MKLGRDSFRGLHCHGRDANGSLYSLNSFWAKWYKLLLIPVDRYEKSDHSDAKVLWTVSTQS